MVSFFEKAGKRYSVLLSRNKSTKSSPLKRRDGSFGKKVYFKRQILTKQLYLVLLRCRQNLSYFTTHILPPSLRRFLSFAVAAYLSHFVWVKTFGRGCCIMVFAKMGRRSRIVIKVRLHTALRSSSCECTTAKHIAGKKYHKVDKILFLRETEKSRRGSCRTSRSPTHERTFLPVLSLQKQRESRRLLRDLWLDDCCITRVNANGCYPFCRHKSKENIKPG